MVDDESDAQDLFRQNFRREIRKGSYSFDFARSGPEALEVIKAKAPVLVLSDINMPGMSGIELLSELQTEWPELPVMMISAYGDTDNYNKAIESGAKEFFTKPIDFESLREEINGLIN